MMRIGIIGAGFSGTALAATLHRFAKQPTEVILIDKSGQFGAGFAYSTPFPYHLLNVRAHDMSAFENEPDHFVNWLKKNKPISEPLLTAQPITEQFVPRLLYGNYLQDLLQTVQQDKSSPLTLTLVTGEVVDTLPTGHQMKLVLADNQVIQVDKVVLALGNGAPAPFPFPVSADTQCIHNPWAYTALNQIPAQDPVMIVGTGLSMIDAVLTLYHQKHQGPIYALSRHGLLPLAHSQSQEAYTLDNEQLNKSLRWLLKQVRRSAKTHIDTGGDWRAIINEVRRHLPALWHQASVQDKKLFFRHLLPYWNIHRHRVHPALEQLLTQLRAQGQLRVIAGRIRQVEKGAAEIKVRHSEEATLVKVSWLINCMGPSLNIMSSHNPLVSCLHHNNQACFDPLRLGFLTTATGALQTTTGSISSTVYSLGPPTKGTVWECMAVPGIRKQVLKMAEQLTS